MSAAAAPPVPPAQDPGILSRLLKSVNSVYSNPNDAALLGLAQGFGAASAPHMLTPVSMGQALGMGMQGAQAYQHQVLQNAIQREGMLPFQVARTKEAEQAVNGQSNPNLSPLERAGDQALGANLISPGMGATLYNNNPAVVAQKTLAETLNQLQKIPANERAVLLAKAFGIPAQGPLPTATTQAAGGGPLRILPGGLAALAGTSGATAGGAAQATYPFQQGLKNTGYFSSPLTNVSGFNVPPAPQLNISSLYPGAQGQQAPGAPMPVPAPGNPQARAAIGLSHPGLSPSQITGQQTAQKNATDQLQQDITTGQEAQQRIANLQELASVAGKITTGPGTEARIATLKALASVPGFTGVAQKLSTITNAQIFNKTALNLSLQTVSSAGQHAYDAFKSVMNAFPELSKTNMANAVVTGSLLATAQYQAARGSFAAEWQKSNNGMGFVKGKGAANAVWQQKAPFMTFFLNSLPPEAVSMLMQKARTNATLRNEIMRARKGYEWLQANVPGYGG